MQNFVRTYTFKSLGYIPRKGLAGSCGNSVFKLLRSCHVFQGGCTPLASSAREFRLGPGQHSSPYFILAILVGMKWQFPVFFICISLMANDKENLFMCLLVISLSPLEETSIQILQHFFFLLLT